MTWNLNSNSLKSNSLKSYHPNAETQSKRDQQGGYSNEQPKCIMTQEK